MKTVKRNFSRHFPSLAALALLLLVVLGCGGFRSDAEWSTQLGGKKLLKAKTSGSISDKVEIWFCPSGEYAKRTQFSGFSGGGGGTLSMADEDSEAGHWQVESGTLILRPENGRSRQYEISQGMDENVISLDGNGYLVERHNECP